MNLKESFRYQNYLDGLMKAAQYSLAIREHALKTKRNHLRNKANPEAKDEFDEVEVDPFFPNDDVIRFMGWLVQERERLSIAINLAKRGLPIDIDAAVETNKFRQRAAASIRNMLQNRASKRMTQGTDYKFNNEGVQSPYYYDIEIIVEEAFNRSRSRDVMRDLLAKADEVSSAVDEAMVNTVVLYEPTYDVNESFDDVMEAFISNNPA